MNQRMDDKGQIELPLSINNGQQDGTNPSDINPELNFGNQSSTNQQIDGQKLNEQNNFSTNAPQGTTSRNVSVLFGKIILNEKISASNFYAMIIHFLLTFVNLTAYGALQPLILLDSKNYDVPETEIGTVLAELILMQTVTKILFTPLYGYMIDKIGRKPMTLVGGVVTSLGYILVPFQKTVFPGYAISKLLLANGINICAIQPYVADYIHDETKGKATGLVQMLATGGSLLGSLIITALMAGGLSLRKIHTIMGIGTLVCLLGYTAFIKDGSYYLASSSQQAEGEEFEFIDQKNKQESFKEKVRRGLKELGRNGWLLISLIINTLARADLYLITTIFALWMKSFSTDDKHEHEINLKINKYENLFFGLGFFGNILYGIALDRMNTMKIVYPTLLVGVAGYVSIIFATDDDSIFVILLIALAGVAMPGFFNAGNYLANKNFPRELRGILMSIINVFGIAGYLILSTVGGYLYDKVNKKMPYLIYLGMMGLAFFVIVGVHRFKIKSNRLMQKEEN